MADLQFDTSASGRAEAEKFGQYVLLEKIAQGGMAEVFLAKLHGVEGFEKIVAIKRILPELSWNREFVSMFINEAKIAARLSHPNIVQIFDFGKVDNYYFIAMEYVHGENLRSILQHASERHAPMPRDLAAYIVARACAGLEHAHKKGDDRGRPLHIVHRDVSPQNVLVSYEGEVKVVDFGIAKAVAENPEATRGVLKGKLSYLSPEQVTGRNLDARSDVFAAGLVLYELLAGRKLFDRNDPGELLDAIVRIDAERVAREIPGLPRALRDVLRRALNADPDRRFSSAGEMQQALEEYLRDHADPGGTLQIMNYMRLLFDDKIGTNTLERLRAELLGPQQTPRAAGLSLASSPRVLAAVAGGLLGVVAVAVAATRMPRGDLRPASPPAQAAESAKSPPVDRAAGSAEVKSALAKLEAGKPAEAVADFEKAFAADRALRDRYATSEARALIEDGKQLFDRGSEEAADRFRRAAAIAPELFDPHFYLAKIYTRRKDTEAALREYDQAIRIDPKSADAQFNLGFIYFSQKQYQEALRQYEKVVDLKPPYLADVFYNISACYEQMGKKPDAIAALKRGVDAVPESSLLRQRLKQLGG